MSHDCSCGIGNNAYLACHADTCELKQYAMGKTPIPVVWYEGVNGLEKRSRYGIATLLNEAFDGAREFEFNHQDTMSGAGDGAVVVIHGDHLRNRVDAVRSDLAALPWALVVVIGDEASVFPSCRLLAPDIIPDTRSYAPNRILWQQMPIPGQHDLAKRKLICGYPHDTQMHLANYDAMRVDRPTDWFFSGQVNHIRRRMCVDQLKNLRNGDLVCTPGFWQGLDRAEYYRRMAQAKIVVCPAGVSTPDTLRVAEALEAGCIPIADGLHHRVGYPSGYWQYVFGENPPFPVIDDDWRSLPKVIDEVLSQWPSNRNQCVEWWKNYKRKMVSWLSEDLQAIRR